jgi:hypothetical protein
VAAGIDISALSRQELIELLGEVLGEAVARLIAAPTNAAAPAPLLTPEDLAKRWAVPVTWVREQYRSGRLKSQPLGPRYVRFSEADAAAFLASDHAKGLTAPVRLVRSRKAS